MWQDKNWPCLKIIYQNNQTYQDPEAKCRHSNQEPARERTVWGGEFYLVDTVLIHILELPRQFDILEYHNVHWYILIVANICNILYLHIETICWTPSVYRREARLRLMADRREGREAGGRERGALKIKCFTKLISKDKAIFEPKTKAVFQLNMCLVWFLFIGFDYDLPKWQMGFKLRFMLSIWYMKFQMDVYSFQTLNDHEVYFFDNLLLLYFQWFAYLIWLIWWVPWKTPSANPWCGYTMLSLH